MDRKKKCQLIEKEIITSLFGFKNGMLEINDLDRLFELRLTGIAWKLNQQSIIAIDEQLEELINNIHKVNFQRNNALLNEVKHIDSFLNNKGIKRLWLKGIRDVIVSEDSKCNRKMVDCDMLVGKNTDIKKAMGEYGLKQGGVTREGEIFYADSIEEVQQLERDHYEYAPFVQMIEVPNFNSFDIPQKIMNRYRVFENSGTFYTDFVLDIHHALTTNLSFEEGLSEDELPAMGVADDLWYCMNKSYYEVWRGEKKDLQIVLMTLEKLCSNNYEISEIAQRMQSVSKDLYNYKVFSLFDGLCNGDNEIISKLVEKVQTR
mgnify:CR=1 FL=1